MNKKDLLTKTIQHFDITKFNAVPIVEQFATMAFQARNLANAAKLYHQMLADQNCSIILCLAGSLFSAGLKKIVYDLIDNNMVDIIVSTGAIIVDQDFFEALGFKHYQGTPFSDDDFLMKNCIDRIYDTYIDEDELRTCDMTIKEIADSLPAKAYSSREFIQLMGEYLQKNNKDNNSIVRKAFEKNVPIFVPAFSDSSAGFGLIFHQWEKKTQAKLQIDSVQDLLELTKIKMSAPDTGLLMLGGGVPKNFAQDTTVAAEILGHKSNMHKYAIQITVADERDGGLSGSTLKEAHSWGKIDTAHEQMVFCEATIALPILASFAYHKHAWQNRQQHNYNLLLNEGK